MLRALDLIGFKSFADKTRFEFPEGITVVVGPNGSGKSNVVDAIKWVLGEQSVKSLRGKEMTDVIFNGSGNRRAINTAEATLTFDNRQKMLSIDTDEVHITRRVYRSGEGEYLINRQPSRLRDIRELLSGTGMGTGAYSVIEQGRVDVLLQSSARERRIIFEEAAGISLFKAKKLESLRRLDRVEQNLLRLNDIVMEVENRLSKVQSQAGKAKRFKEYNDALQRLRTEAATIDWHRLTEELAEYERQLAELDRLHVTEMAELAETENSLETIDSQIEEQNELVRRHQQRVTANREKIAGLETTLKHQRDRSREFEQDIVKYRGRLVRMNAQAGDLREQIAQTRNQKAEASVHCETVARRMAEEEGQFDRLREELKLYQEEGKGLDSKVKELLELEAQLGREASGLKTQVDESQSAIDRNQSLFELLSKDVDQLVAQRNELAETGQRLEETLKKTDTRLKTARQSQKETRGLLSAARDEVVNRKERCTAVEQRVAVLEDFQRRHEGVGAGVREVLSAAANNPDGPWRSVIALVADLVRVSVESAPLVEATLGPSAGWIVLSPGSEVLDYLSRNSHRLSGRVGFLRLDQLGRKSSSERVNLSKRPGVLGRADQFVEADKQYKHLIEYLLGDTWVVETMAHAISLAEAVSADVRFVTLAGELISTSGTVHAGPSQSTGGLISSRSELRELKSREFSLQSDIEKASTEVRELQSRLEADEQELEMAASSHRAALESKSDHTHKITVIEERLAGLQEQQSQRRSEMESIRRRGREAADRLEATRNRSKDIQIEIAEINRDQENLVEVIGRLESTFAERQQVSTEVKVELAKSQERLRNLEDQLASLHQSQEERHRNLSEHREQLDRLAERLEQSERILLQIESELATLYLDKESLAIEAAEKSQVCVALRDKQSEYNGESRRINKRLRRLESQIAECKMADQEVRSRRHDMAERLRDDYGIELAELDREPTEEEKQRRQSLGDEIDQLRDKLKNLGNVNLEALAELEDLDRRFQTMSNQLDDLTRAKSELLRIIERIDADSRELFANTMEEVREHFQQLFSDLFGGGQADIILEEDVDILESGIEIVARPPGKEPRNISLLSGGEKTLTCVALLLAIFRSRPSPFCILDEVDAALDEANIDRFTKVLQGFLSMTQFVIITHSKKTMTCADSIYGITMQESGISKQVSVRFEDVSEDGHVLPNAVNRAARTEINEENRAA